MIRPSYATTLLEPATLNHLVSALMHVNNPDSYEVLGRMLIEGHGMFQNHGDGPMLGLNYMIKAAEHGSIQAGAFVSRSILVLPDAPSKNANSKVMMTTVGSLRAGSPQLHLEGYSPFRLEENFSNWLWSAAYHGSKDALSRLKEQNPGLARELWQHLKNRGGIGADWYDEKY